MSKLEIPTAIANVDSGNQTVARVMPSKDAEIKRALARSESLWVEPLLGAGLMFVYKMFINPMASETIIKIPWVGFNLKKEYVDSIAVGGSIFATNLVNKNIMPFVIKDMATDPLVYNAVNAISPVVSMVTGTGVSYILEYVQQDFAKFPQFREGSFRGHLMNGVDYGIAHLVAREGNDVIAGAFSTLLK